jgi:hypothetical protein
MSDYKAFGVLLIKDFRPVTTFTSKSSRTNILQNRIKCAIFYFTAAEKYVVIKYQFALLF